nr:phage antirepressor [Bifidobacterium dentium]
MSDVQLYSFDGNQVRTLTDEQGEPWFVAKDVCAVLGYANPSKAINDHVDDEDKLNNETLSSIGQRGGWLVNESGLYSLIITSKMPNAKAFKRWVTSEVLPSIRRRGVYATDDVIDKVLGNPDFGIRLLSELKDERARRRDAERTIEAQRPKVLFAESVETSDGSILVGELARDLRQNGVDIGQNRLFGWLRGNGYLISRRGESWNQPTQRALDMGLFEVKTRTINEPNGSTRVTRTTKVTGKGRVYFTNLFLGRAA